MAERKSGPVKPPVIDLTARPAEAAKPEKTEAKPAATAKPAAGKPAEASKPADEAAKAAEAPGPTESPPPRSKPASPPSGGAAAKAASVPAAERRSSGWGPAVVTGVAAAVVAVGAAYGLAAYGLWPVGDAGARVDALQAQLAEMQKSAAENETAVSDLSTHLAAVESDVSAKLAAVSRTVADMHQSVAALGQAKPAADLGSIEAELKTLSSRLDAVAAGASSADAGALAANLATVQQGLAALSGKVAAVDTHLSATDGNVAALQSALDSARAAIDKAAAAPSPAQIAASLQLPLLISALEADLAAGRPYAADLASLTRAAPETRVPAAVSEGAANGLPAPDDLARHFEARMPDMLGALPGRAEAGWQGQVTDWVKGVLALRPQGEQAGDTPAAVLSRVEGAVNRHDFATAAQLFDTLPGAVRDAAGDTGAQLHALAAADNFVAGLRRNALAPAGGAAS